MRPGLTLLAPPVLIVICWAPTFVMAGLALALPNRFDLVAVFMALEDIGVAAFSTLGSLWIGLCFLIYLTVDHGVARGLHPVRPMQIRFDQNRASTLNFRANLIFLGVTGMWIVMTAHQVGGLPNLVILAYADSLAARDLLLQNKLFTGMRLFTLHFPPRSFGGYTARPACICGVETTQQTLVSNHRCSEFAVSSGSANRDVAAVVAAAVHSIGLHWPLHGRGRLVAVHYIPLGAGLFMAMWVLREAVTNPTLDRAAWDIGTQKLAFYFVNDLWNSYKPLVTEIKHTFGMFSLRGVLFFTFTDGYFGALLSDRIFAIEEVRGGGDFSLFTAPYVDFGPFIGAGFVALAAVVFRYAFHKGRQSFTWAAIYGQTGASLLFSTHGVYFTHHNFFFSVIVLAWICHAARPAAAHRTWVKHA